MPCARILTGLCRRSPSRQSPFPTSNPQPLSSLGHFFSFHPLNCFSICDAGHVVHAWRSGERSATRVSSLPSERQCSGGSNAHPIGRTDHLTPATNSLPRGAMIAKRKYERFPGDKGRLRNVGGGRGSAQQLQNFISPLPSSSSVCLPGGKKFALRIPMLIPGGPC